MCTVSWVPALDGYILLFNRDERRTRPVAIAPSVRVIDGVSFLAPTDPEGGGTWVSVNTAGVTVALANRYGDTRSPEPSRRESRGRLVMALASSLGLEEAEQRLSAAPLDRYEGFTLVVLEPGAPALTVRWDGRTLTPAHHAAPGLLVASSAVDETAAVAARTRAFKAAAAVGGWTRRALCGVHSGHQGERGPLSVCMHRADATTVSLTHVEVDPARIAIAYHAGQPCETPPVARVSLARTSAAIGG